jgi:hypothetical protein
MRLRKLSQLSRITSNFYHSRKKTPPIQILALENKGIPILSGTKVDLEYKKLTTRRRLLLSLIKDDGWNGLTSSAVVIITK